MLYSLIFINPIILYLLNVQVFEVSLYRKANIWELYQRMQKNFSKVASSFWSTVSLQLKVNFSCLTIGNHCNPTEQRLS